MGAALKMEKKSKAPVFKNPKKKKKDMGLSGAPDKWLRSRVRKRLIFLLV